ncbi:MAG: protein-tyrosine-phosphatase [Haliea sp.]|jgi:protein-tyrosine phosphatase|nr:protein-tyrosine-phosphatase [Haliea sp.]
MLTTAKKNCVSDPFRIILGLAALWLLASCGDGNGPPVATDTRAGPGTIARQPEHGRKVPLSNTLNTRDLGGYRTDGGRRVRSGMLFRSDSLAHLDDADIAILRALELSVVTDFRSQAERDAAPDRLPRQSPAIDYRTLAINNPAVDVAALRETFYSGQLSTEELIALTDRTAYVEDERLRQNWGRWVSSLAEPGALPQLFHCTAGKDRTGFAAALVLLTLGVSKEDVMRDFLLSNEYLAPKIERYVAEIQSRSTADMDGDLLRQVLGVTPHSLDGAFRAMEANYGSIDNYIEQGLGIDPATRDRLRTLLLE